jgi:hypothetical protein
MRGERYSEHRLFRAKSWQHGGISHRLDAFQDFGIADHVLPPIVAIA